PRQKTEGHAGIARGHQVHDIRDDRMRKVIFRAGFDPRFAGAVQEDDAQREPEPAEAAGDHHEVKEVNEIKEIKEKDRKTMRPSPAFPLLPLPPLLPLLPLISRSQFQQLLRCSARRSWDSECSLPREWRSSSSARTSCRQRAAPSPRGPARLANENHQFPR